MWSTGRLPRYGALRSRYRYVIIDVRRCLMSWSARWNDHFDCENSNSNSKNQLVLFLCLVYCPSYHLAACKRLGVQVDVLMVCNCNWVMVHHSRLLWCPMSQYGGCLLHNHTGDHSNASLRTRLFSPTSSRFYQCRLRLLHSKMLHILPYTIQPLPSVCVSYWNISIHYVSSLARTVGPLTKVIHSPKLSHSFLHSSCSVRWLLPI